MSGLFKLLGLAALIACGLIVAVIAVGRMRAESGAQQAVHAADDAAARAINCANGDRAACPP